MNLPILRLATALAIGVAPALAQEAQDAPRAEEAPQAATPQAERRAEVLAMIGLPARAQALRERGVDKEEVRAALKEARSRKLKARETSQMLEQAGEAVDRNGPIDNFGAFVRTQLEQGLRGRELAQAIRAEHEKRGRGRGRGRGASDGAGEGTGGGERGARGSGNAHAGKEKPEKAERSHDSAGNDSGAEGAETDDEAQPEKAKPEKSGNEGRQGRGQGQGQGGRGR